MQLWFLEIECVGSGGEVRQGTKKWSKPHQEDTDSKPARLMADSAEIADGNETEHRCDIVRTRDESRLRTLQIKTLLYRRNTDAYKAIDNHTLPETKDNGLDYG